MVARAAVLAPRSARVQQAREEARSIIERAVTPYARAVLFLQQGDDAAALEQLKRSQEAYQGLLHQGLLLRYARTRDRSTYSEDEHATIQYYLATPPGQLKQNLVSVPFLALFRPRVPG